MKKYLSISLLAGLLIYISASLFSSCNKAGDTITITSKASVGRQIFFDKNLSNPPGQSCSSCHASETAFTDLNHNAVSPGAVDGLFGNRNAPTIMYSMFTPTLHYSVSDTSYVGGFFLDGRVNTLQQQAQKPFLNPLEMNNSDVASLVAKIEGAGYFKSLQQLYGTSTDTNAIFNNVTDALAAFEASPEVNPFTSKFDYYLKGQVSLTAEELSGMQLFQDSTRAKCATCHLITPDSASGKILFTDHTYNNDGVPKNPNNPYYTISTAFNPMGANYVDVGLGPIVNDPAHNGEFKVPTLRNIALTAPYFHNGSFNTLEDVVHFYNTRDLGTFALAEEPANVDSTDLGNLQLTSQEEKDIVAFMKTLTDGYQ